MLDIVNYDRKQRKYVVAHGNETAVFPAGRNGRKEANRFAMQMLSPRLYRLAMQLTERSPVLESRAWKAAEIVLAGGVTRHPNTSVLAMVESQSSEYGDYNITAVGDVLVCDCADFQGATAVFTDANPQPWCKHLLAYQLALRLEKRQCYHCEQLVDAELMTCPNCGQEVTPF